MVLKHSSSHTSRVWRASMSIERGISSRSEPCRRELAVQELVDAEHSVQHQYQLIAFAPQDVRDER